jgi:hypothetical protein
MVSSLNFLTLQEAQCQVRESLQLKDQRYDNLLSDLGYWNDDYEAKIQWLAAKTNDTQNQTYHKKSHKNEAQIPW